MKYIPVWLHYYLMRFEWYQRRFPVLTISDITNEALKVLEQSWASHPWVMPIVRVTRDQLIEQWGVSAVASKEYKQEQRETNYRLRASVDSLSPKQ